MDLDGRKAELEQEFERPESTEMRSEEALADGMIERHEWQRWVLIRLRGRVAGRPTRLLTYQSLEKINLLTATVFCFFVTRLKEIERERFAVCTSAVEAWRMRRVYLIKQRR